jgi:hypothetical protein
VAGEVNCTDKTGSYVVCPVSQGCSDSSGQVVCGDASTGAGTVTCDGPSDCAAGSDCCYYPAQGITVMRCTPQAQPGVIGSGCPTTGPGTQFPNACDPLNPTANCPAGKSCVSYMGGAEVSWSCQ